MPGLIGQKEFFSQYPQFQLEAIRNDSRFRPLLTFLEERRTLKVPFFVIGFRDSFEKPGESYGYPSWYYFFCKVVPVLFLNVASDDEIRQFDNALNEIIPYCWPAQFVTGKKQVQPFLFGNAFWALKRAEQLVDAEKLHLLFRDKVEKERRKFQRLERKYADKPSATTELDGDMDDAVKAVVQLQQVPREVAVQAVQRAFAELNQTGSAPPMVQEVIQRALRHTG
ncbi:MAG TPA: hypothetical protein VGP72_31895 [Planctomycetota bacterium]|jgi:hypothetical protein